ncbi:MAG TPA: DUF1223 domain-containing protein, partial [Thermoanaerobaculia bacterium]|nr:DUF1223 domain-containing protein [Thermoanaerobaculia bacterium]
KLKNGGIVSIKSMNHAASFVRVELVASADPSNTSSTMNLVVVLFENGVTTAIRRGENSGRTLRNDHIVRWTSQPLPLDRKTGGTQSKIEIPINPGWHPQHLGVAAFIQDSRTLEIFAAAVRNPER